MKQFTKEEFLNKNIGSMIGAIGNNVGVIREQFSELCRNEKFYENQSEDITLALTIEKENPELAKCMDFKFVKNNTDDYKEECKHVKDRYDAYLVKIDPENYKNKSPIDLWKLYEEQLYLICSFKFALKMFGGEMCFTANKAWEMYYALYKEKEQLKNLSDILKKKMK